MSTTTLHPQCTEEDRIQIRLAALNDCAPEVARAQFQRCCGSWQWIHRMERARPFADVTDLEACAGDIWESCSREDWLEAFAAHPRLGEQPVNRWSRQEQSGVAAAPPRILAALHEANLRYEAKFGYTFILCASGKNAIEVMAELEERLKHSAQVEIQIAAAQQRLILQLRLRKLSG